MSALSTSSRMKKKKGSAAATAVALAAICGSAALLLASASAFATVYNPPIHMAANGVEYMSGGVSAEEAELMRTIEPRWPAVFEFAVKDGKAAAFAANAVVTVRDAQGNVVLDGVRSAGPYLVARLEPGRYSVLAQLAGEKIEREIAVGGPGTSTRSVFEWPQGTDMATPRS